MPRIAWEPRKAPWVNAPTMAFSGSSRLAPAQITKNESKMCIRDSLLDRALVRDFKLLVALFLARMAADTHIDAC